MKKSRDYDSVFKTLKMKHKRLFISVINEVFGTDYPPDAEVELIPSEGYLTEGETLKGEKAIQERINDFLIRLEGHTYLLECQSYDDGAMAIRIAEYAFITARKFSVWDAGEARLTMPEFSVIYIKHTDRTPARTEITFVFPNGTEVPYSADNIFLDDLSREYIIQKRLFPYIPFYIARYEKEISMNGDISQAISDLEYFREQLAALHQTEVLTDIEFMDLREFINTIVTHITDGNPSEERLVNIMGGEILELESDRLIRIGEIRGEARGEIRGETRGEIRGENYKLISLVCKKILRGKKVPEIAEDLEEDVAQIQTIYDAAMPFAPDFDREKIYQKISENAD